MSTSQTKLIGVAAVIAVVFLVASLPVFKTGIAYADSSDDDRHDNNHDEDHDHECHDNNHDEEDED
jgi:ABC-type Zn2+ transport system substrate-binding protein/surface adhesin